MIISFLLLFYAHWMIMFLGIIIYIFYGYLYNEYLLRFKKSPFRGLMCKVVVGVSLIYSGYIHSHGLSEIFSFSFLILAAPYILFFISICLLIDIPDIKGDKVDDNVTVVIFLGEQKTILIVLLLNLFALLLALNSNDPLASITLVVSFPFFIYALVRGMKKDILRSIRYPISIINLFAMTVYPYLFIPIFIIFYLSKYYYWHRFNLHYPTMLVDD